MSSVDRVAARGGAWLVADAGDALTPERLSDDHRMIAQTANEFVANEVAPALDRLEQKDWALARELVVKAASLGLVGTDVPEDLGGVGLDKAASLIVGEAVGRTPAFGTTFGAQTGLSIIPILSFGTPEQQKRYLPRLAEAELLGAYALSESGSGTDALAARARAVQQPDGSFVLSGEKMWITCGGFADLFIVFAQAPALTAFIVERAFGGVTNGKEEHKMGLHGSSTTPLILQDVRVPAANVLGQVGRGHKVALNTLNYGRFKLAAMCSGGAKAAMAEAAAYAASRKQFGRAIASFGAIQHKLGEMTARIYGVESALYRTCGLLDAALSTQHPAPGTLPSVLEEFATESAMLKVSASEMIDYVVDESVQIHGGNGYVTDYPAERRYRDARVNRIFEGTNEINRLIVPGMLARRAAGGGLPILDVARTLNDESAAAAAASTDGPLASERTLVTGMKKTAVVLLAAAIETYGDTMAEQQEVVSFVADAVIEAFVAESALLRALQAPADDPSKAALHETAARVVVHTGAGRVEAAAREALGAMAGADAARDLRTAIDRWLDAAAVDLVSERRALAAETVARKKYLFEIV